MANKATLTDVLMYEAGLREGRLDALREVREMVATITVRDGTTAMKIIQEIDAMIAKEEGK